MHQKRRKSDEEAECIKHQTLIISSYLNSWAEIFYLNDFNQNEEIMSMLTQVLLE